MNGKGGGVFIESKMHASLVVIKTLFKTNKENSGGAVYLNIKWRASGAKDSTSPTSISPNAKL